MLDTVIFFDLYNSSDFRVGYFTIYTFTIRPIVLYTEVFAGDRRGNPEASTSVEIGIILLAFTIVRT